MFSYKNLSKIVLLVFVMTFSSVSAQDLPMRSAEKGATTTAKKSIVGTAAASENYQTLMAVMKATGFENLLNGSAPFTIFAPSDLAFKHLRGKSVEDLLNSDNQKELRALLGYHIVAGKLSASKILKALCRGKGKTTFTSIQGDVITATMKGIDIVLSDSFGNTAIIVVADANQRNGVIHEIDAVIRPGKS